NGRNFLDYPSLLVAQPALVNDNLAAVLDRADPGARTLNLRNAGQTVTVTRVGTIDFSKSNIPLRESLVVFMDVRSASAICFPEKPDHVQQLGVTLEPNADRTAVQAALVEKVKSLGVRADVQSVETSRQIVSDVTA